MSRFGIVLPQHEVSGSQLIEAARTAEQAGLSSVWVSDHLWGRRGWRVDPQRPVLEGWTSLAAVAASTQSVTVGTLATRVGLRNPLLLATMAETVHRLAGPGRLVVGLGIGDETSRSEQESYGLAMKARSQRLEELLHTVALLKERGIRTWVAGATKELLEAAAQAGGWNLWASPEQLKPKLDELEKAAGGRPVETSWAGSFPGEEAVKGMARTVDHVIVAAGARNYQERVNQLVRLEKSLG